MSAAIRKDVTRDWRKLLVDELHNLRTSLNSIGVIKRRCMKLAVRVESINAHKILVGKPERKRPLGRPGVEWKNIETHRKETRTEGVDWFVLAQDRYMCWDFVDTVMNRIYP